MVGVIFVPKIKKLSWNMVRKWSLTWLLDLKVMDAHIPKAILWSKFFRNMWKLKQIIFSMQLLAIKGLHFNLFLCVNLRSLFFKNKVRIVGTTFHTSSMNFINLSRSYIDLYIVTWIRFFFLQTTCSTHLI